MEILLRRQSSPYTMPGFRCVTRALSGFFIHTEPMPERTPEWTAAIHEANRLSWNAATIAHNSHKNDQAKFLRDGKHFLYAEELDLLENVKGKTVAHLLCNAGQDTLSLVQLGAIVTAVDISDAAIAFARQLSAESALPATFIRGDVYDWLDHARQHGLQFDAVFSSYGALCWLSDLHRWARGIQDILKPGGAFVLMEFHPVMHMLSTTGYRIEYPYCGGGMTTESDGIHDYVAQSGDALAPSGYRKGTVDFRNPHPCHEFHWGIADLMSALIAAGLRIERFEEYPYSNGYRPFPDMVEQPHGRFMLPSTLPVIPLMFGIRARRP